jgi:hypothetical protein
MLASPRPNQIGEASRRAVGAPSANRIAIVARFHWQAASSSCAACPRGTTLTSMIEHAQEVGADAIIGMRYDQRGRCSVPWPAVMNSTGLPTPPADLQVLEPRMRIRLANDLEP